MSVIIRVDIQDGLLLASGGFAPATYTCVLYMRVPEAWLQGDEVLEPHKESILELLYGKSWRRGNEDGSRYHVRSMTSTRLSDKAVADRVWLQHDPADRRYQTWYYHVVDEAAEHATEHGYFASREPANFNL